MTAPRLEAAKAHAQELRELGVPAYVDPAEAAANLPAVLLVPPAVTFDRLAGAPSVRWRLVVLANGPAGLAAWEELDSTLELLAAHVSLEDTATPASYTLEAGSDPVPAYIAHATE